ncbi:competence type IV pilus minor pilin ComGF [Virgibacillus sp. W0430]|uniref:competence type IV pilus minor pilin ComGF n=1 Tax=Virgibacillus sp. W0430 TaxID=3391580 RepID=UPI003F465449
MYTGIQKNELGFTLIHYLFLLTILTISLPLLSSLLQSMPDDSTTDELSIRAFTHFIRDDVIRAIDFEVNSDVLTLYLYDGKRATVSKYNNVVRRQVNGEGHEVYLIGVKDISFVPHSEGFYMQVVSEQGDKYEKSIQFYQ